MRILFSDLLLCWSSIEPSYSSLRWSHPCGILNYSDYRSQRRTRSLFLVFTICASSFAQRQCTPILSQFRLVCWPKRVLSVSRGALQGILFSIYAEPRAHSSHCTPTAELLLIPTSAHFALFFSRINSSHTLSLKTAHPRKTSDEGSLFLLPQWPTRSTWIPLLTWVEHHHTVVQRSLTWPRVEENIELNIIWNRCCHINRIEHFTSTFLRQSQSLITNNHVYFRKSRTPCKCSSLSLPTFSISCCCISFLRVREGISSKKKMVNSDVLLLSTKNYFPFLYWCFNIDIDAIDNSKLFAEILARIASCSPTLPSPTSTTTRSTSLCTRWVPLVQFNTRFWFALVIVAKYWYRSGFFTLTISIPIFRAHIVDLRSKFSMIS